MPDITFSALKGSTHEAGVDAVTLYFRTLADRGGGANNAPDGIVSEEEARTFIREGEAISQSLPNATPPNSVLNAAEQKNILSFLSRNTPAEGQDSIKNIFNMIGTGNCRTMDLKNTDYIVHGKDTESEAVTIRFTPAGISDFLGSPYMSDQSLIYADNTKEQLIDGTTKLYAPAYKKGSEEDIMTQISHGITRLATERGGADHLFRTLVLSSHSMHFNTLSVRKNDGGAITNTDVSLTHIIPQAAKQIEKGGTLVISICEALPDNNRNRPSNDYEDTYSSLKSIIRNTAMGNEIYIIYSTKKIDYQHKDGTPTGGMMVMCPDGEARPYVADYKTKYK